jgi:hypothetical protein
MGGGGGGGGAQENTSEGRDRTNVVKSVVVHNRRKENSENMESTEGEGYTAAPEQ